MATNFVLNKLFVLPCVITLLTLIRVYCPESSPSLNMRFIPANTKFFLDSYIITEKQLCIEIILAKILFYLIDSPLRYPYQSTPYCKQSTVKLLKTSVPYHIHETHISHIMKRM